MLYYIDRKNENLMSKACSHVKFDIENRFCVKSGLIYYLANWNWIRENAKTNNAIEKKNLKIKAKVEEDKKKKK